MILSLFLLVVPAQDTSAAIPSLGARVTRVRFFEGGKPLPSFRDRQYTTRFDSAATRSVYVEIGLSYPPAREATALRIECAYTAPGGAAAGTALVDVKTDAGWELSVHAGGTGNDTPGRWAVGTYPVACRYGGRVIATGSFEIARPAPAPATAPAGRAPARTTARPPPATAPSGPPRDPDARVPATLGSAAFGPVRAKVTALRLFESGADAPERKERVITSTFDALTTRFINVELELQYPRASKPAEFEIACRFDGPDSTARTPKLLVQVDAGWVGSYHTAGWGARNRGLWPEGIYRVTCRSEGKVVAASEFKVVKAPAAVESLGASLTHLRFFQSESERLPIETRQYGARFDARTTRWIKTEFGLVYPAVPAPAAFTVECAYTFPDGTTRSVSQTRRIPAGWTGSVHVQGIGGDRPGLWIAGFYRVSCRSDGREFAAGNFEVFDADAPATAGAAMRFTGWKAASPVPGTAFDLGSVDSLSAEVTVPQRAAGDSTDFRCVLTDPAGVTSEFPIAGTVRDRALAGSGPLGPPRLRGTYRMECRAGGRAVVAGRYELTGKADLSALDARLITSSVYEGTDSMPDDEAVPDVSFSAARIRSLWLMALLDRPTDTPAESLPYSCRIAGARNTVLADSRSQALPVRAGDRVIVFRQRLTLLPRQRWVPGKYTLTCASAGIPFIRTAIDVTR